MEQVFSGKVVAVTGGAQGIGAGIARRFSELGAAVAVIDLLQDDARRVTDAISLHGAKGLALAADITRREAVDAAFAAIECELGRLDHLVNNAAPPRGVRQPFPDNLGTWDREQEVLLRAPAFLVERALPLLRQSRGTVVNIGSVLAHSVAHESAAYHVAKAGLVQLTRYLACQLGGDGIRVNAVLPGIVDRADGPKLSDDPVNRALLEIAVPLRRSAQISEIADAVAFLASDQASYITGQCLIVDGGLGLGESFNIARTVHGRLGPDARAPLGG
jgi:glucose 1-dehydrogenase